MKLDEWIADSGLRRIDVAEMIGRDPAVVTRLCEGEALTAANVRAIHRVTGGAVCPNDLFGLAVGRPAVGVPARTSGNDGQQVCHQLQLLPPSDMVPTDGPTFGQDLIQRIHDALVSGGVACPAVMHGHVAHDAEGQATPVLMLVVHGGSVHGAPPPDNAKTGDAVDMPGPGPAVQNEDAA